MIFRSSNIRNLGILLIINILIYTILLRWFTPDKKVYLSADDSSIELQTDYTQTESKQSESFEQPSIFAHAQIHDELIGITTKHVR